MCGSAKAGTTAERHKCELRILTRTVVRAPPKRASGELCFPLTKTYMDVGTPERRKYLIFGRLRMLVKKGCATAAPSGFFSSGKFGSRAGSPGIPSETPGIGDDESDRCLQK